LTTAVIVQARMASTRLPGKVMEKLGDRTVLHHVLIRCAMIPGADKVICAVPDQAASDPLEAVARECGAGIFRGSENDVLARYLGAAQASRADIVMRVTSDCPLIDPNVCGAVLQLRERETADYAANNMPPSFPHGLDCEVFTSEVLAESAVATQDPYDREHVSPWIRRAEHLKRTNLLCDGAPLAHLRWTLDYPEDLRFFQAVFALLPHDRVAPMREVLAVVDAHPEVDKINATRRQRAM
jgi:spore coat polysaccharide biosynthesis protein SpsF